MTLLKTSLVIGITVFSASFLAGFKIQEVRNNAVSMEKQIYGYELKIKEQEDKRVELVYRIADKIKKYDKNEAFRVESMVTPNGSLQEMNDIEEIFYMVSDSYHRLKDDNSYNKMINDLSHTNELIIDYRDSYNDRVEEYNEYVENNANKKVLDLVKHNIVNF